MKIISDSNIFIRDFHLTSPSFTAFLSGISKLNYSLYIPKIVFDEVVNKYTEQVGEVLNKAKRIGFHGLVLGDKTINDTEQAFSHYEEFLRRELKKVGAQILDYPTISHEQLVRRALERRKPFRSSDTGGYRDSLIWESLLVLSRTTTDEIVFITNNTTDFYNDKKDGLHSNLLDDLNKLNNVKILLFKDLEAFIDELVKPTLEKLDEIKIKLENGTYANLNLKTLILDDLSDLVNFMGFSSRDLNLPSVFEELTLSHVEEVNSIYSVFVHKLPTTELLITLSANIECEFEFFMFKGDYYSIAPYEGVTLWEKDWNEWYVFGSITKNIRILLNLLFNENSSRVSSARIVSIESIE